MTKSAGGLCCLDAAKAGDVAKKIVGKAKEIGIVDQRNNTAPLGTLTQISHHSSGGRGGTRGASYQKRRIGGKLSWLVVVSVALSVCTTLGRSESGSAVSAAPRPNIVLILTDNQRWDSLWAMPNVQSGIVQKGVAFNNSFVTNPLCCPSRATILTGRYSHSTGVYTNESPLHYDAFRNDEASTVATWLNNAGYHTALIGKYMNGYRGASVPPGWDRWAAFKGGGGYYNYQLREDDVIVSYGSTEADYSTDVFATKVIDFIKGVPANEPFFVHFSPYAAHGPAIAANRHLNQFSTTTFERPPSFNEADVSDKPAWVRNLTIKKASTIDTFRRKQLRTLLAVDEAVANIVDTLESTGRLNNTLIMFASDNGDARGEHRLTGYRAPYEEVLRVPTAIRYDALISTPRSDAHLVLNVDWAQTFAEIGGVSAPGAEGSSLVPLLTSPTAAWRSEFLIEHAQGPDPVPTYCGIRGTRYVYVRYSTAEEELYDLSTDPYQLMNRAKDASLASVLSDRRARLKTLCAPPPPGLTL
jgi:N-acetylglucosamine-6-sulfatase